MDIPVIAAGGIADGRGVAAAILLGASGVWIGTRLLASREATIHDTYRTLLLDASEADTLWSHDLYDIDWPDAPHRALANSTSQTWRQAGQAAPGHRPGENEVIGHRPTGEPILRYQSCTPMPGTTGAVEAMSLWAGQGVAQLKEISSAAQIIDEIYQDARNHLQSVGTRL